MFPEKNTSWPPGLLRKYASEKLTRSDALTRHGATLRHKGHKAQQDHESFVVFVVFVSFVSERGLWPVSEGGDDAETRQSGAKFHATGCAPRVTNSC